MSFCPSCNQRVLASGSRGHHSSAGVDDGEPNYENGVGANPRTILRMCKDHIHQNKEFDVRDQCAKLY